MASSTQYIELTEDELIKLAVQKARDLALTSPIEDLVEVVEALQARRNATAESRRRIGHYLRHAALQQQQYDKDMASGSDYAKRHAKAPTENIDSLRVDKWTSAGELRLSDLQRVVPVQTFDGALDGEKVFYDTQADRLEQWKNHPDYETLPDRQKVLLPCIAAQHISDGYRGWTHGSGSFDKRPDCYQNIHQSTMNSLLKKKHIVGTRTLPGMAVHRVAYLMLKDPSEG